MFRKRIRSLSSCNVFIKTSYSEGTFLNKTFSDSFGASFNKTGFAKRFFRLFSFAFLRPFGTFSSIL
ncbi:hypothetical protein LEP1GSC016_0861 [Leptospira borgpetersenii serovar Hardjo-bovis str. Sponselee]|uniref:Uncharacterized protein n=1 Tax=Leptospira borgpetersenii serovar Hardjo-bovis str. Sponselee TaxID=1303729 RepID=M6BTS6_LEPBO|nr:hypothetical protein LEP1GSC016_0861 [Leptospira borgpetersenii serovar Hardjo-bovis str. Sponselee]